MAISPPIAAATPSRLHRTLGHAKRLAKKKMIMGLSAAIVMTGGYTIVSHEPTEPVRYVLAAVTRGTLVVSMSGSGQVSDENQLDMKPPVSAAVKTVKVKSGQVVKASDVLVELDAKDAQKTVRDASQSVHDAQLSLQSAQLSLQKIQQKDPAAILRAENALAAATRDLERLRDGADAADIHQAEADLQIKEAAAKLSADGTTPQAVRDALDDAVSDLKATGLAFRDALREADDVLGVDNSSANATFESLLSIMNSALLPQAESAYHIAKGPVATFKTHTDALPSSGVSEQTVLALAEEGAAAADLLRTALERTQDVLANTIVSPSLSASALEGLRSDIASARSAVASRRTDLTGIRHDIESALTAYANAVLTVEKARKTLEDLLHPDASDVTAAEERVAEAQAALDDLHAGADTLDIASSQNNVAQRRSSLTAAVNRLNDAKEVLSDYTIRAPFDATIGDVAVKPGDQASASTALLTLLTKGRIATITMNEVDAIKIKPGQKATLTFDAVPDLTIAGTVSQVDGVGAVSQGVVSYDVIISFDSQDDRMKPGMSVSASIVTDAKTDVLLVSSSAVQTAANGLALVQTLPGVSGDTATSPTGVASETPPETLPVQTGISNDQQTEITDGLQEGDLIVVRTIQPTANTPQTSGASVFSGLGGGGTRTQGGGGGGAGQGMFIPR